MRLLLLRAIEAILRRYGYCIIPVNEGCARVYTDDHIYTLNLTAPVGHKITVAVPR